MSKHKLQTILDWLLQVDAAELSLVVPKVNISALDLYHHSIVNEQQHSSLIIQPYICVSNYSIVLTI